MSSGRRWRCRAGRWRPWPSRRRRRTGRPRRLANETSGAAERAVEAVDRVVRVAIGLVPGIGRRAQGLAVGVQADVVAGDQVAASPWLMKMPLVHVARDEVAGPTPARRSCCSSLFDLDAAAPLPRATEARTCRCRCSCPRSCCRSLPSLKEVDRVGQVDAVWPLPEITLRAAGRRAADGVVRAAMIRIARRCRRCPARAVPVASVPM